MSYFPNEDLKQEILDGKVWTGWAPRELINPNTSKLYELFTFAGIDFSFSAAISANSAFYVTISEGNSTGGLGNQIDNSVNMNRNVVGAHGFDVYEDPVLPVTSGTDLNTSYSNADGSLTGSTAFNSDNGIILQQSKNYIIEIYNLSNVRSYYTMTWFMREIS